MLVSVSGAGVARGVIADAPGSPAPAAAVGSWRRSRARSRTENGGGLHPWGGGNDGLWIAIMPIGAYGGPVREFSQEPGIRPHLGGRRGWNRRRVAKAGVRA